MGTNINTGYVRKALRVPLINGIRDYSINLLETAVAWENRAFTAIAGLYVVEYLIPVDGTPHANYMPGERGIYQLNVMGVRGEGTGTQDILAASIAAVYFNGLAAQHVVAGVTTSVLCDESQTAGGFEESGRWVVPVRIRYRAFVS